MYIKLFDSEKKVIVIFNYILLFFEEKHDQERRTNYQLLGKY